MFVAERFLSGLVSTMESFLFQQMVAHGIHRLVSSSTFDHHIHSSLGEKHNRENHAIYQRQNRMF